MFEGATLRIDVVDTKPTSDAYGDVERQSVNVVVLPLSGVFSKHDNPRRHVVGTPSHAVFIASDTPYRIGFPGGIGDRALTLRFGEALAPDRLAGHAGDQTFASSGLLPADAMMLRNLLLARLRRGDADEFEIEALGLDLLNMSLRSMRTGKLPTRSFALAGRTRALERVREAVALAPADKWNVATLARVANTSPFHLCHIFRQTTGTSIYNYVLRERLAYTLDAVLDRDDDLTSIALDAGFASHSHFTARFRRFFGCTPAALRRSVAVRHVAEIRKIMTARRSQAALD
jgi:AraC-like DNA-binding protein